MNKKMRYPIKKYFGTILTVFLFVMLVLICCKKDTADYGVFLGINGDQIEKLEPYRIVVIEPSEFSKDQVTKLHKEGKTVYAYLNIGALEEYRPYYDAYKHMTLGIYENWPDEQWMDVSQEQWQEFVIDDMGKKYFDMGFDGFFIDNTDIYYHYPEERVYQGLQCILKGLRQYPVKIIINGGDTFVSKVVEDGMAKELFDGINQETVFTSIDFEDGTYHTQSAEENAYFKEYLEKAKSVGLEIYLLEYGADLSLAKKIESYCRQNDFVWYNAPDLSLT